MRFADVLAKYDPNQPRDDRGRWTTTNAEGIAMTAVRLPDGRYLAARAPHISIIEEAQRRGNYGVPSFDDTDNPAWRKIEDGFLTTTGRFVGRDEAASMQGENFGNARFGHEYTDNAALDDITSFHEFKPVGKLLFDDVIKNLTPSDVHVPNAGGKKKKPKKVKMLPFDEIVKRAYARFPAGSPGGKGGEFAPKSVYGVVAGFGALEPPSSAIPKLIRQGERFSAEAEKLNTKEAHLKAYHAWAEVAGPRGSRYHAKYQRKVNYHWDMARTGQSQRRLAKSFDEVVEKWGWNPSDHPRDRRGRFRHKDSDIAFVASREAERSGSPDQHYAAYELHSKARQQYEDLTVKYESGSAEHGKYAELSREHAKMASYHYGKSGVKKMDFNEAVEKYDPNQPRDEDGRFASTGQYNASGRSKKPQDPKWRNALKLGTDADEFGRSVEAEGSWLEYKEAAAKHRAASEAYWEAYHGGRSGKQGAKWSGEARRNAIRHAQEAKDFQESFDLAEGDWAERTGNSRRKTQKSADEISFETALEFEILKTDDEKQIVYGFASVSKIAGVELEDLQGDVISTDDIQKAAHDFMIESRVGGEMHYRKGTGVVVESLIVDGAVKKALGITRPEEGWFIGYKVTDAGVWKSVKEGKFKGFSIGGTGVRTTISE